MNSQISKDIEGMKQLVTDWCDGDSSVDIVTLAHAALDRVLELELLLERVSKILSER